MNPYRSGYDAGNPTPPPRWYRRRVPNWVSALVIGLAVLTGGVEAATPALHVNGIKLGTSDSSVYITAYGVDGTGVADSTTAINNAIAAASAGSTVYFPAGAYKATGSITANVAGVTLDLGRATINSTATAAIIVSAANVQIRGGTINLNLAASAQFGIQPSGTVTNLIVDRVLVNGTGLVADGQTGFGNFSGPVLTNVTVQNSVFQNLVVGIDYNADSSGSITGGSIFNNRVYNIVGTGSGQGYGIHHANGSGNPSMLVIESNIIDSAMRHDIYQAKGSGVAIIGNRSINHRTGLSLGAERPAFVISRSHNITVTGNVIESPVGGCMSIDTDVILTVGYSIVVSGNSCNNWFDFGAITTGTATPATDGFPSDILFANNTFSNDLSVSGASGGMVQAFHIYDGKRITFANNVFKYANVTASPTVIEVVGAGESGASNTYTDLLKFDGNQFFASGGTPKVWEFDSAICTSIVRMDFNNNLATTSGTTMSPDAGVTDPNIYAFNTAIDGLGITPHSLVVGSPLSAPGLTGTVTGTYTLGGTPTITNPVINGMTSSGSTALDLTGNSSTLKASGLQSGSTGIGNVIGASFNPGTASTPAHVCDSNTTTCSIGVSGQATTVNGTLTVSSTLSVSGPTVINGALRIHRTTVADAPYTVLSSDRLIAYTSISAARVVSISCAFGAAASPNDWVVKDESGSASGTNTITVTPSSGTINGAASVVCVNSANGFCHFYSNGTNCFTY